MPGEKKADNDDVFQTMDGERHVFQRCFVKEGRRGAELHVRGGRAKNASSCTDIGFCFVINGLLFDSMRFRLAHLQRLTNYFRMSFSSSIRLKMRNPYHTDEVWK